MSINIDALWDFGNPAGSEQRFIDALTLANDSEKLILQTQIARTYGLRKDFERARNILAQVKAQLPDDDLEAQTRYHLELGRSYASTAHGQADLIPANLELARDSYLQAVALAIPAGLDELAIDALHMMVVVDSSPQEQLAWNQKALALLEKSQRPAAKKWEGSLRNNVGYALHLAGDYDSALAQFQLSRAAYVRQGQEENVLIADWMIAWTYRAQRRFNEALNLQLQLERQWDALGKPDPFVYEELEILYRELKNPAKAEHYQAKLAAARS